MLIYQPLSQAKFRDHARQPHPSLGEVLKPHHWTRGRLGQRKNVAWSLNLRGCSRSCPPFLRGWFLGQGICLHETMVRNMELLSQGERVREEITRSKCRRKIKRKKTTKAQGVYQAQEEGKKKASKLHEQEVSKQEEEEEEARDKRQETRDKRQEKGGHERREQRQEQARCCRRKQASKRKRRREQDREEESKRQEPEVSKQEEEEEEEIERRAKNLSFRVTVCV